MKLTDCTIRDGGHINKWMFDDEVVRHSYQMACAAGVDYFEFGYRQPKSLLGLGKYAHCEDLFIWDLVEIGDTKPIVMIDTAKADLKDFDYADKSPFWGVRVAAYPDELKLALVQAKALLDLGYHVWVNPMASVYLDESHYRMLESWKYKSDIEALYLADSFGSLLPPQISNFMSAFIDVGYLNIGFHAHNNLQLAVANTLEAVHQGATHIDATIYGMGRGAGNAPIEIITSILSGYDNVPYLDLINKDYRQSEFEWGALPEYVLSGSIAVHPYYALAALEQLSFTEAKGFFSHAKLPVSYSEKAITDALGEFGLCY